VRKHASRAATEIKDVEIPQPDAVALKACPDGRGDHGAGVDIARNVERTMNPVPQPRRRNVGLAGT
jgi:hypothetical protein